MSAELPDVKVNVVQQDEVLKCSICKNNLSSDVSSSTKINACNSTIICGQCGPPNEVGKYLLFPCVNRFEGCKQLLQYERATQHETVCQAKGMYACPICSTKQYLPDTLLKFIDHYYENHECLVLLEPLFTVNVREYKTDYFLYCDNVLNCLFLIYVDCAEGRVLVNASVAGNKSHQVKQTLNILVDAERLCTDFNDNSEVFHIKTDENMNFLTCKFRFEILSVPAPMLLDYHDPVEPYTTYPERRAERFPKIILDDKLIAQYGDTQPEYKLSECLKKLENSGDQTAINITCDFCENYIWDCKFTTTELYSCKSGVCVICNECPRYWHKCFEHQQVFENKNTSEICNINFYCRYNCGLFFKIWQLQKHEKECGDFYEEKYVMEKFGIVEKNCGEFVKGNRIAADLSSFYKKEEIWYVLTHSGQKCRVTAKLDNGVCKFKVIHEYEKSRFYIRVRIYSNGAVREDINEFEIPGKYSNGHYFCTFFLAIFFQEIKRVPLKIV